ncbi:sodium-translocating pyrophosphatase [Clostridium estertheticum]|uniref:sodium-translocating pyrophosphatase n=1 Tax=Clostridium estertheticum TaxID=238834 RepID=UPI001CF2BC58|nr:sodium-translocating pyrophosphatase [Clostridium estertheticum]MCB2305760.1 sodium-translocating pyrophosphatase [Clostridium estertheticum]MCB2347063.1 sodium-translocating pyrophosphatase [Clostridium estertheticum]MCB2348115.1 sodium-translocating pyrophosphatase [Clostridium estertheticum]WAG45755.1 sodium-translocating pyrophosphatase [Clostridium estertheticum]
MNTNKTDKIVKFSILSSVILASLSPVIAYADESNLKIPELSSSQNGTLMMGLVICLLGMAFGFYQFLRVKKIRAHKSMLDVSAIIFETCKTYLIQQGKFIAILFLLIGSIIAFYFGYLQGTSFGGVLLVLGWTIVGILGSYGVAWYGIRMNTFANSRMAFASLKGKPLNLINIPLDAGMSIGVLLICVELFMMLIILIFVPRSLAGASFIGFAIGESLGASALRIAGGIFTKIADIGSDLMKIAFKIKEDDPRNPGVIADCTGDNAGDSVGPTADGFETYGVTGVALISFIVLAVGMAFPEADRLILQSTLLTWIFTMRILMVVTSIAAFYINRAYSGMKYSNTDDLDFEQPLTNLIWISSILSIIVIFVVSYLILGPGTQVALTANSNSIWYVLAIIISCGTLGGALIPEVTKIFTSGKSKHVQEVVTASREGGASLNILSGLVAGNFSAFWQGMIFVLLMFVAYIASTLGLKDIMIYPSVFAFGLVAFGLLSMGPVTIAVDSYGPVTDNAQSIYELSLIETIPNISKEIERDFGFKPDFEKAKYYLEANDGAGNTFKATAKPVLIGTAVVGATTMIFSLILVIQDVLKVKPEAILNLLNPYTLFGFMCGGAIIYWFTGASTQAVSTGAYRAVEFIKKNIELDEDADQRASTEKSKEVVKICTQYAQKGMFNIFVAIFSFALAFAFFSAPRGNNTEPVAFFVAYLISIAVFGLYQAIFMANAGGCWDNAKKVVEVDLDEKGTPLHDACVIGDTVGDPFKDTSSVALNPIIKFTTLFGMLTMEIAISERFRAVAPYIGAIFFIIAIIFVWRSFYGMRIKN